MKYCPITYEIIADNESYSVTGLRLLAPGLKQLAVLDYSADEQRAEAIARAGKMSIQGVQDKLSAQLNVKQSCFEIVSQYGHYILKPQSLYYPQLPENEAISMSLAALAGLEVPVHGLLYCKDQTMTYFIKRFDRMHGKKKLAVEDFAQLTFASRDTKYRSSMEKVIKVVNTYCTFPKIELAKLFRLILVNFLIGNEDMHLKNFSLITREHIVTLAPAYDLLNTTIMQNSKEELALPLNGKKSNLSKKDFLNYLAKDLLGLTDKLQQEILAELAALYPAWLTLLKRSFLTPTLQERYATLLEERFARLFG